MQIFFKFLIQWLHRICKMLLSLICLLFCLWFLMLDQCSSFDLYCFFFCSQTELAVQHNFHSDTVPVHLNIVFYSFIESSSPESFDRWRDKDSKTKMIITNKSKLLNLTIIFFFGNWGSCNNKWVQTESLTLISEKTLL